MIPLSLDFLQHLPYIYSCNFQVFKGNLGLRPLESPHKVLVCCQTSISESLSDIDSTSITTILLMTNPISCAFINLTFLPLGLKSNNVIFFQMLNPTFTLTSNHF